MDQKTNRLHELQQCMPLKSHWLKKDYVKDFEMVFIYYNIEPFDYLQLTQCGSIDNCLACFDKECLWEIMKDSHVPFVNGRGIPLKEFIEFLSEKHITIPTHLQNPIEVKDSGCRDIEDQNLKSLRPGQLQKRFARTFAACFWKDKSNQKISANELITKNDFKTAMKLIGADKIDPETHAEWISDLSPRSKKNQKKTFS